MKLIEKLRQDNVPIGALNQIAQALDTDVSTLGCTIHDMTQHNWNVLAVAWHGRMGWTEAEKMLAEYEV